MRDKQDDDIAPTLRDNIEMTFIVILAFIVAWLMT